ncbi:PKD domain-containing protein, partial [Candidatus Parcubacteria bacterium]|nr:PKD domain-containing protein [Candidatus Parcubacteria bacterium]
MRLFIFAIFPILFFGNLVFAQIIPIENGKVYVCPLAKDLNQVNPKCDCRVDLILREKVEKECKIDGKTYQMFLTIEEYDGKEYYKILGFENGGAGINLPPEAKISGNTEGKVGETLTFDASLSFDPNADPLDFYWELEGKEKKEGKIVSFNFPTPGNFILKLTVSDGMEEHSTFAEISIKKENFSLSQSQKIPKETPFLTETPPPSLIENAFEETPTQTPTFFQKESSETKEKANLEVK